MNKGTEKNCFLNNLKPCSGREGIYYPEMVQMTKSNRFNRNGNSWDQISFPGNLKEGPLLE